MSGKLTCGVHHVGLSVENLDQSRDFFCDTLGFDVAGEVPDYPAVFVSDGSTLITLWQVTDPQNANGFDRRANIGLHHLALRVLNEAALEEVYARLQSHAQAVIEFAPKPIREGSSVRHFICAIPGGGIRIEFATPFV